MNFVLKFNIFFQEIVNIRPRLRASSTLKKNQKSTNQLDNKIIITFHELYNKCCLKLFIAHIITSSQYYTGHCFASSSRI